MKKIVPIKDCIGEVVPGGLIFACGGCGEVCIGPKHAVGCSARCRRRINRREAKKQQVA